MGKGWLSAVAIAAALLQTPVYAMAATNYEADIAPVFAKNCVACHSGAIAQGKLAMDSLDAIRRGGASGPVLVPGNSAASPIYQRLVTGDRTLRMPLGSPAIPAETIALIKQWIDGMPAVDPPAAVAATVATSAPAGGTVDFHRDIEPIFRANCYECHSGPKPQSQLRLDVGAAALKGG
ncbi:MAG: hypothetical protein IT170_00680, partial [Bryobacterales bacterium]|nr:hypothetical protein [Bryobacterales bacterium]